MTKKTTDIKYITMVIANKISGYVFAIVTKEEVEKKPPIEGYAIMTLDKAIQLEAKYNKGV